MQHCTSVGRALITLYRQQIQTWRSFRNGDEVRGYQAVRLPFEPGLHFLQHDASVVHLANASTSVLLRHTAPDGGAPRRKCGMCWRGGVLLCRTGSTFAAAQVAD